MLFQLGWFAGSTSKLYPRTGKHARSGCLFVAPDVTRPVGIREPSCTYFGAIRICSVFFGYKHLLGCWRINGLWHISIQEFWLMPPALLWNWLNWLRLFMLAVIIAWIINAVRRLCKLIESKVITMLPFLINQYCVNEFHIGSMFRLLLKRHCRLNCTILNWICNSF